MEEEILEELEKIYKDFKLEVEFVEFRIYKVKITIQLSYKEKIIEYTHKWDVNFTKSYNISIICYNIDKRIIESFKKEVL